MIRPAEILGFFERDARDLAKIVTKHEEFNAKNHKRTLSFPTHSYFLTDIIR